MAVSLGGRRTAVFNVCPACGQYSEEKAIDVSGPIAVCPFCGYGHRFLRLPLFLITGASATGKTTVCLRLPQALPECVALECDILWRPEFAQPAQGYREFRNLWLRVAKNVAQAGKPVLLSGSAVPSQYEACPERRYFRSSHYLALVCDADELARRLQARPQWRQTSDAHTIEHMVAFNQWFVDSAETTDPPMTLLDTTALSVVDVVRRVSAWVRSKL
jgi:predicted kinase